MKQSITCYCRDLLLLLCLLFFAASGFAQTRTVSGKVMDESGSPLAGVTVSAPVSHRTSISEKDGSFTLAIEGRDDSLKFTYIGYDPVALATAGRQTFNISLTLAGKVLTDVVVVGYGTQKKKAVTGSVASVGYDDFKDRSFSNVAQSLEGAVAGVNITTTQGAPGFGPTIRIRGVSSITAGASPLYVIDGMALENFDLNLINPQDIQSIDILKDAASSAIYGSRGANGVILVTTKLGRIGKPQVNATYEHGVQAVTRRVELMDAQEWIRWYIDARNNAWVQSGPGRSASDPNSARMSNKTWLIPPDFLNNPEQFGKGTDWQDLMFRTAHSNNVQLSVSGATDKTQYLVSAGYLDQQAVVIENFYKRLSLRTNVRTKLSDKVTVGINLAFNGSHDRTDGTDGKSDVISLGLQSDPIFPEYNENGNLGYLDPNSEWSRFQNFGVQLWHPYSLIKYADKLNQTYSTLGSGYIEYKPIPDLTFRTSLNGSMVNRRYNWHWYKDQGFGYSSLQPSQGSANTYYTYNWLNENTLSYDKAFGEHTLGVLVGYSSQKNRADTSMQSSQGFPNDLVQTLNAATQFKSSSTTAGEWSLLSYLARVSYSFKNKYFLNATVRRDGSSRFGENSKWGVFPSVSAGWQISDERFMQNAGLINSLKLRVSYGETGNNLIPNYGYVSLLSGSKYSTGSALINGLRVTTSPNPDLQWERTGQFNLGVDLSLLDNRINLTADFYNSVTRDMLLNVPVPIITGFSSQLANIGRMRNRGIELSISSKNIVGSQFRWTTDFNISANRNKVLQLGPNNAPLQVDEWGYFITEVGRPVSTYYGYIFDGVFMSAKEMEGAVYYPGTTPGDPRIRDVNDDKIINENDRTYLGNAQPDFTAGLVNTLGYGNFEFSFMLHGVFGNEIWNQQTRFSKFWNDSRNSYAASANYWRSEAEPGDGNTFKPSAAYKGLQTAYSSYWMEDGTFVRIKNIRLSYMLPQQWTRKSPFKNARVYVNAENVYVFSDYLGFDPENSTYSAGSTPSNDAAGKGTPPGLMLGADYGAYPIPLTVTFGAKFDF